MNKERSKKIAGWAAITVSTILSCFWSFWGIVENFHEGWYSRSFWNNTAMMFAQYLLVPVLFIAMSLISLRWQRVGGIIHVILGIFLYNFFGGTPVTFLFIMIPFIGIGIAYYFSNVSNKRVAYIMLIGLPLLIILGFGTFHAIRVSNRFNDNHFEARLIKGNGVELIWAPAGPGWPDNGVSWNDAKRICSYLREDGKSLSDSVQNIWRLPTLDEAVRSMVYHGNNAGGTYKSSTKQAEYKDQPDKESPLWNMYSKVIYWWTSDEMNEKQAYIAVYNGSIWPRMKESRFGYLGFRAVKNIK